MWRARVHFRQRKSTHDVSIAFLANQALALSRRARCEELEMATSRAPLGLDYLDVGALEADAGAAPHAFPKCLFRLGGRRHCRGHDMLRLDSTVGTVRTANGTSVTSSAPKPTAARHTWRWRAAHALLAVFGLTACQALLVLDGKAERDDDRAGDASADQVSLDAPAAGDALAPSSTGRTARTMEGATLGFLRRGATLSRHRMTSAATSTSRPSRPDGVRMRLWRRTAAPSSSSPSTDRHRARLHRTHPPSPPA